MAYVQAGKRRGIDISSRESLVAIDPSAMERRRAEMLHKVIIDPSTGSRDSLIAANLVAVAAGTLKVLIWASVLAATLAIGLLVGIIKAGSRR